MSAAAGFVPKFYGYWRSSASWRVRWAFELKNFKYEYIPVNIFTGENQSPTHLARNALGLLPVFEPAPGIFLAESMAIIDWLDRSAAGSYELFPKAPLLRAHTIALCELINAETAPLQTPRAQKRHSDDEIERSQFAAHFIREGLRAFQAMLLTSGAKLGVRDDAKYCVGDAVTAADLFLIPQIYNAARYNVAVETEFPKLWSIFQNCMQTEACKRTSPPEQKDAIK